MRCQQPLSTPYSPTTSNSLGNGGERNLVHLSQIIRHAYEIKVRRHHDQGVRTAHGRLEQRRQCRIDEEFEPDLQLFQSVLSSESGKHLFDPLPDESEHAVKVGSLDSELAFDVEKGLVEEGSEFRSIVAGDENGLAEVFGSSGDHEDQLMFRTYTIENRDNLNSLIIQVPRLDSRKVTPVRVVGNLVHVLEDELRVIPLLSASLIRVPTRSPVTATHLNMFPILHGHDVQSVRHDDLDTTQTIRPSLFITRHPDCQR